MKHVQVSVEEGTTPEGRGGLGLVGARLLALWRLGKSVLSLGLGFLRHKEPKSVLEDTEPYWSLAGIQSPKLVLNCCGWS